MLFPKRRGAEERNHLQNDWLVLFENVSVVKLTKQKKTEISFQIKGDKSRES